MTCETLAPTLLENIMQVHNFKQVHIAKPLGVSVATLSEFLRGKRPLKFNATVNLQEKFFKGDKTFIFEMFKSYQSSKGYIRPALEYLSINYHLEELEEMLKKIKSYGSLDELVKVYELTVKYQRRNTDLNNLLHEIKELHSFIDNNKYPDLIAHLYVLEAYIYGINREHKSLFRISKSIEKYINKVNDDFVKSSLENRLNEVLGQVYLFYKNNPEKARECAYNIINSKICAKLEAYSYYLIGTSYMFQDYEKARDYISRSHTLYTESGYQNIGESVKQSVYVLDTYWGKNLNDIPKDMHLSEKAYRMAKKGDVAESLDILENLKETPFRNYYKAVATKDSHLQFKALGKFIKDGDYFFAQLPLTELKKDENYRAIAESIYYS